MLTSTHVGSSSNAAGLAWTKPRTRTVREYTSCRRLEGRLRSSVVCYRTSVRTTDVAALPFVALLDACRPWTRLDFLELFYCVLADCFGRCGQVLWLWPCEMSVDALR